MNEFERPLPKYRLVETHFGDDLQAVAARELGDANRWVELVWLNRLVPPYITDDARRVVDGVLLSGALLKVPSASGVWTDAAEYGQVFERDCALVQKRLVGDASGDMLVFSGVDNLHQQLQHRVVTPRGQARRHPDYGCMIWRLLGRVNGPLAGMLGAQYVKAALASDYRVSRVIFSNASVSADVVNATAKVEAIEGGAVDLTIGSGASA